MSIDSGEEQQTTPHDLWEEVVSFAEDQCRLWQIGQIRFWIRRRSQEWFIAFEPGEDYRIHPIAGVEGEPPEGLQWNRYVAGTTGRITLRPVLPDRPVVIRPSSPVKILPGKGSSYFIHLPVWIAIMEGGEKKHTLLTEHSGDFLSSTWFGNPDDGELCYSFTTNLYKSPEDRPDLPLVAMCPLTIRNGSPGTLDFQRICVRVPYLNLYNSSRFLCTNEVQLTYRGAEQSQIDFRQNAPAIETGMRLATPPRLPVNRNIIKKSFEYIKNLSVY